MTSHRLKTTQHRRRSYATRVLLATASIVLGGITIETSSAPSAQAASVCASSTAPVYETFNPTSKSTLLTRWATEASTSASKYGYVVSFGTPFAAFTNPAASDQLRAVHRLFKAKTSEFLYTVSTTEPVSAKNYGYSDQGVAFYATTSAIDSCQVGYSPAVQQAVRQF